MLALRRQSLRQPLSATVIPVTRQPAAPLLEVGSTSPAALVLVTDPGTPSAPPEDALQCLYGLTPAESRLAAAFAAGDTLQDYAEATELSLNYVRWLLKQIEAKTDTRSQVELVRLLVSQAPALANAD
jgi:DNA-binding CsgD family transcriptional regulator